MVSANQLTGAEACGGHTIGTNNRGDNDVSVRRCDTSKENSRRGPHCFRLERKGEYVVEGK